MIRAPKLPVLPGYSFDREVGQTRFHKSSQFELLRGEIPYLSEADRPGTGGYPLSWATSDKYPSIYPRRGSKELPGWIAFDKQILTFDAYFQEAMWEVDKCPFQVRKVKIYFYPEDGTIQVNEPRVDNSGMAQGTLINRQRIRFPKPMDHAFYNMIDFNIGKNVELYGKVFRIVNCDKFTRQFLNRMGIYVGDPLDYPEDPFTINEGKKKDQLFGKKPATRVDTLGKFLKYDRNVLRFYGYWDDRSSQYGFVHKLEIYYYLADDTIEIKEVVPPNSGRDSGFMFMKRAKLPKSFGDLPGLGYENLTTILNVFTTGFLQGRYVLDPINCGANKITYYQDNDLAIGACINVYGRKVVLTDCDVFTKEYYRTKYGMDTFNRLEQPEDNGFFEVKERELPPWNGIGSYEDSEGNCHTVIPQHPKKDYLKLLSKGKVGIDSHVLRFKARMISTDPLNDERNFVISYYLADDQISVYERGIRNSGFQSQLFVGKREIFKPGQERFVSRKPEIYTKEDFWIGNVLKLEGYVFELLDADDYCMRYMELNCHEFPKSNMKLIMDKIREKLRPIYKDFICKFLKPCIDNGERPQECKNILSFYQLEAALKELLRDDITKHEIITVARHFRSPAPGSKYTKCDIIDTCRTECRRLLWLGFDRLAENLRYKDPCNTGYIKPRLAYSLCRGAKIPVEPDLLTTVLELVDRNNCGDVSIEDLLNFFDCRRGGTSNPVVPFNHKREFSEMFKMQTKMEYSWVDCVCFLQNLGLEGELKKEGTAEGSQNVPITPEAASTLPNLVN